MNTNTEPGSPPKHWVEVHGTAYLKDLIDELAQNRLSVPNVDPPQSPSQSEEQGATVVQQQSTHYILPLEISYKILEQFEQMFFDDMALLGNATPLTSPRDVGECPVPVRPQRLSRQAMPRSDGDTEGVPTRMASRRLFLTFPVEEGM